MTYQYCYIYQKPFQNFLIVFRATHRSSAAVLRLFYFTRNRSTMAGIHSRWEPIEHIDSAIGLVLEFFKAWVSTSQKGHQAAVPSPVIHTNSHTQEGLAQVGPLLYHTTNISLIHEAWHKSTQ